MPGYLKRSTNLDDVSFKGLKEWISIITFSPLRLMRLYRSLWWWLYRSVDLTSIGYTYKYKS